MLTLTISLSHLLLSQLQVDSAIGRDVSPSETGDILRVLSSWSSACEGVLTNIETQILRANQQKEANVRLKGQIESEVANIKKTLKVGGPKVVLVRKIMCNNQVGDL